MTTTGRRTPPALSARIICYSVGAGLLFAVGCANEAPARRVQPRPSILLLTLDTTRADVVGPDAREVATPAFNALAARGERFRQAYSTVPETLPSHSSMMTGLYPAGHGVHENGRFLSEGHPVVASLLHDAGYRTDAFVSTFVLARQFGLARGFDSYNDAFQAGRSERSSVDTTDAVIAALGNEAPSSPPRFLWVHFNDPHAPYTPPEPFLSRYPGKPYLGEVAAMDEQIGRLIQAFEAHTPGPHAMIIVADHGEGLGEHGERLHGNLLYQGTMHVPLVVVGPGAAVSVNDSPVSTRRVFHTILGWAGLDAAHSLLTPDTDVVLAEAMKPFLEYGWQPQVMAIAGHIKSIRTATLEAYDVSTDSAEAHDLGATAVPSPVRAAAFDYPIPNPEGARAPASLSAEDQRKIASLGYVSSGSAPVVRKDAPRPADMSRLFDTLERASTLFVSEQYAQAIPLLESLLAVDPHNLDALLRLATAHSALGHEAQAVATFKKAADLAPNSRDVALYTALHYEHGAQWELAVPALERAVAETPERVPAVQALARIRERQGRLGDAIRLRQQAALIERPAAADWITIGRLAMQAQQTPVAIDAFEHARAAEGPAFTHDLELGVLYLAARRYNEAGVALDRVPPGHADYPMALFKRAQVSVLLHEPDAAARIDLAKRKADGITRPLIASEKLFQSIR